MRRIEVPDWWNLEISSGLPSPEQVAQPPLCVVGRREADARRAAGQPAVADSLDRLLESHQIVDGNFEVWAILRALAKLPRPASAVEDH